MTKTRRLFHTVRGVLFVALVLVTGFGALSSVNAQTATSTRISLPDSSTTTDGTIRSVTRDVNVDTGVDIGPNAPSGAPGSSANQPLPKFSGINAPVWVNSNPNGPVQVADDMIVYGITDVRNGLVNNGRSFGEAGAAAAVTTVTVEAYPGGNVAKKYLKSDGTPGSIGGFLLFNGFNSPAKITKIVLSKRNPASATPNANISRVSVVVTNNDGQLLGSASATSIADTNNLVFSPALTIMARVGDVHFDFTAAAINGNGTNFEMEVSSIAVSTVAGIPLPIAGNMPYSLNTAYVNAMGTAPIPTATLTATPSSIRAGGSSALTWSSTDADSCIVNWSATTTSTSGSVSTNLNTSRNYNISCTGDGGTATANATITVVPAPTVTLTPSSATIYPGSAVTLAWNSANTTSCSTASPANWPASTAITGSKSVSPATTTTTYSITCTNSATGLTATASATVTVATRPTVTVTPSATTSTLGDTVNLAWSTTSGVCSSLPSNTWWQGAGAGQTPNPSPVKPSTTGTYTYSLTCSNAGGPDVTASTTITVIPAPTATFTASPASITSGSQTTLTWNAQNADAGCSITSSPASYIQSTTSGSETLTPAATTTYTLSCINTANTRISMPLRVTVVPAPTVTLTTPSTTIQYGNQITLTWNASNAAFCYTATPTGWTAGSTATSGAQVLRPLLGQTTYSISCISSTGVNTTPASVIINAVAQPVINSFSASPTSITPGASSTLTWNTSSATSCALTPTPSGFTSSTVNGSATVTPAANTTYSITCTNAASTNSAPSSATVTVAQLPTLTFIDGTTPNVISNANMSGISTNQLLFAATAKSDTTNKPKVTTIYIKYTGPAATMSKFGNFQLKRTIGTTVTDLSASFKGWHNLGTPTAPRWTLQYSFATPEFYTYTANTNVIYQLYGDVTCGGGQTIFDFILDRESDIISDPRNPLSTGLPFTPQTRFFTVCPSSFGIPINPPTFPPLIIEATPIPTEYSYVTEPAQTKVAGFFSPFIQTARAEFIPTAYAQAATPTRPPYNPVTVLDNLYIQGAGAASTEPGNLYIEGYLQNVNGALLINDDTNIAGFLNADGSMAIGENLQVWNNLQVFGATDVAALTVANGATISNGITVTGGGVTIQQGSIIATETITARGIGMYYTLMGSTTMYTSNVSTTIMGNVSMSCGSSDYLVSCTGKIYPSSAYVVSYGYDGSEINSGTANGCYTSGHVYTNAMSSSNTVVAQLKSQAVCFRPRGGALSSQPTAVGFTPSIFYPNP